MFAGDFKSKIDIYLIKALESIISVGRIWLTLRSYFNKQETVINYTINPNISERYSVTRTLANRFNDSQEYKRAASQEYKWK